MKKYLKVFACLFICTLTVSLFSSCGKEKVEIETDGYDVSEEAQVNEENKSQPEVQPVTCGYIAERLEKMEITDESVKKARDEIVKELKAKKDELLSGVGVSDGKINSSSLAQKLAVEFPQTNENGYQKFYDFLANGKDIIVEETNVSDNAKKADNSEQSGNTAEDESYKKLSKKLNSLSVEVEKSKTSAIWFIISYMLLIIVCAILLLHNFSVKDKLDIIKKNVLSQSQKSSVSYSDSEEYAKLQREISALRGELNQKDNEIETLKFQIGNLQRSNDSYNAELASRMRSEERQMTMNASAPDRYNRLINSSEDLAAYGFKPCKIVTGPGINGCKLESEDARYARFYCFSEGGSITLYPAKDIKVKQLGSLYLPYFDILGSGERVKLQRGAMLLKNGMADCYDIAQKGSVELL